MSIQRKSIILITFSFFIILVPSLNGQSFIGKITFRTEEIEIAEGLAEKSIMIFGEEKWEKMTAPRKKEYYILNDTLIRFTYDSDDEPKSLTLQEGDSTYLELIGSTIRWDFESDPSIKYNDLILIRKTKKRKTILGYECTKYIYRSPTNENFKIEQWITDDFSFDSRSQSSKYFSEIFSEYGTILERWFIWERAGVRKMRLLAIEQVDYSKGDIIEQHKHKIDLK